MWIKAARLHLTRSELITIIEALDASGFSHECPDLFTTLKDAFNSFDKEDRKCRTE